MVQRRSADQRQPEPRDARRHFLRQLRSSAAGARLGPRLPGGRYRRLHGGRGSQSSRHVGAQLGGRVTGEGAGTAPGEGGPEEDAVDFVRDQHRRHRVRHGISWTWCAERRQGKTAIQLPTRPTQPCIPPGSLNRVPASAWVWAGMSHLSGGR